jgi:hypothetical protein
MGAVATTSTLSHWDHMFQGMQQSSDEFYTRVEQYLALHNLKDTKLERVKFSEGGIFSSKREYLQIRRGDHVFHLCAAPFGNGFFVSSWLGAVKRGLFSRLFKPLTYYKVDTALMFQSVTHGAVLATLDEITTAKGLESLVFMERRPEMRDLFTRLR